MKIKLLPLIVMLSKYAFIGLILQSLTFSLLLASETIAQENKSVREVYIDIKLQNADILETFHSIEAQTDFIFNYEKKDIKSSNKISITGKQKSVADILMEVSKEANLKFRQVNRNINVNKLSNNSRNETKIEIIIDDIEITGRVTGEDDGEGLPGVNVIVKGTSLGTVTDVEGNFTLSAPEDGILVFSSVGYLSEEITIGSQSVINLVMSTDITSLEEIVVIGYGTVERRDVTGAVGSIKTEDIVRNNPTQTAQALQGQIAGVNIQKVKGRPGDGYTIDIRGLSNFDENNEGLNEPLIVIDGVMGGNLNALNPADIATMDVLKDASSTAIYGSRGANGVILITTNKGQSGRPTVSYGGYVGVKSPTHIPEMMDAAQFYQVYNFDRPAEGGGDPRGWTSSEVANAEAGNNVDWIDMVTDPALQMSHTISVSGGSESTTYNFSGGYLDEGGNTLNTSFKRYTVSGGLESRLGNILKVGFTSYYAYGKQQLASTEALRSAYRARPTGTVYYDDLLNPAESSDFSWNGYAAWMGISDKQVLHPMIEIDPENSQRQRLSDNFLGNVFAEIEPIKGLTFRTSISAAVENIRTADYRGTMTKSQKTTRLPKVNQQSSKLNTYTWDNILTYNLNKGDHNLTVTGLYSVFQERIETTALSVENLPYRSLWYNMGTGTIAGYGSGLTERSLLSYMGRVNYSFKDKYLITLTGRSDGASQLSEGNKWAFFPSAAIAWRAGDEEFIKNLNVFSDLKFRVSYGEVGNSAVRPYQTQANITQSVYDFGGSSAYGFSINNLANRTLIWEKSKEFNLGLNMGFLDNRITAAIELYKRNTEDLILPDKIPTSTGFSDVTANVGEIENKGIELTLNTINIRNDNFTWSTTINLTHNRDKVVKLADGQTEDIGNLRFVGESVKPYYTYVFDGIWQTSEVDEAAVFGQLPGQVKLVDLNGDDVITPDDRQIIGKGTPDLLMGMRNLFTYKNFDFSFFMYTRQGVMYKSNYLSGTFGDLASDRYNRSSEIDYWTSTNPSNTFYGLLGPGLDSHQSRGNTRAALTHKMANFVRISDITLGYTFPRALMDRWGVGNLRVYGQAQNPFVFTDYLGFNPEYNSGVNDDDLPFATYLFGIDFSF